MENLDLNFNVKSSDAVLREAAEYFADQGYSVLNQGFAEIVSSPKLLNEYTSALTVGCNANDEAVMKSLMENTAETILNESLGGIMPLSSLSMPVIRKLWPKVSMKDGIKTIVAKAPIFSIVYTKPYLYRIDPSTGVETRKDLPRATFGAGGYDDALDLLKVVEEVPVTANTFVEKDFFGASAGQKKGEIDADFEVVSVSITPAGESATPVVYQVGKKLGLDNNIVADLKDSTGAVKGTIVVRVQMNMGKVQVAVMTAETGTIKVKLAAHKSSEWNEASWDVNFDMLRQEIRIGTGEHMNAPLSVEQVQDVKALYNIDAAAEITEIMTNVFAQKLDHQIIDFLVKCFINRPSNEEWKQDYIGGYQKHLYSWSVTPAAGFSGSTIAWREELKPVIDYAATALMQETYFQSGSFVICGNPHDTALLKGTDWQYKGGTSGNIDGVAITYNVGVFQSNSYVYKVVSSLNLKPGSLLLSFIPSGEKQLTTAYYPYSFVMEKGTGYRSPNHELVPSIMMTKRHTFFEFTPATAMIAIENNTGTGQFNRGNLYKATFTDATDANAAAAAAGAGTWGNGVK